MDRAMLERGFRYAVALAGEAVVVTKGGKVDEGAGGTHGRDQRRLKDKMVR